MRVKKITAEEAKELSGSVDMYEHLLSNAYQYIKWNARDGKDEARVFVEGANMQVTKEVMEQLEKDGYVVYLDSAGFLFKKIQPFTNIAIFW